MKHWSMHPFKQRINSGGAIDIGTENEGETQGLQPIIPNLITVRT